MLLSQNIRKELFKVAQKLHMNPTVYESYDYSQPMWDGRRLQVVTRTTIGMWTLAHEIGHFLACPPERRHLPEWGLGSLPEWICSVPRVVSAETQEQEEKKVVEIMSQLLEGHFPPEYYL